MKRAIRKHLGDFVALILLAAAGVGTGAYIVANQDARGRFPLIEEEPFKLKAEFSDAHGVMPGQGQTVRVAGVRIGDIEKVEVQEGVAVVTMAIERKYKDLVREDASALLRPRTGLKDMLIEVDPGTNAAPAMKENDRIPVGNTAPDVDPDEILSALDADTRAYLQLLVNGAGKGLENTGDDLGEVYKRFLPLHRDLARVDRAIAERRVALSRLIHNYGSLMDELADKDHELTRLVDTSNVVFGALASEDRNISRTVARLPSALRTTRSALAKVGDLGHAMTPALESLRPAFRQLDRANRAVRPFVREAEPIVRRRIRPFVTAARPYVRDLRPAASDLATATPDLGTSFGEFNRLFNIGAYNPGGAEKVTGDRATDRKRDEGYLFWLAWAAHNGNSVFSTSDASGPLRRGFLGLTCQNIRDLAEEEPFLAQYVFAVTDILRDRGLCPGSSP